MKRLLTGLIILLVTIGGAISVQAEVDSHAKKIINMVKDGKLGKYHGQDGILRTPKVSGTLYVDTIQEYTSGNGVIIVPAGGTSGLGAILASSGDIVSEEGNGVIYKTIIDVTNTVAVLADGADGEGIKLYDFPEGIIVIHSVVAELVVTNSGSFNASDNDHYYFGLGTVEAANANDDLTTTEQNLIAKQTIDTAAGATRVQAIETFLAAPTNIDGSTTALDIWFNYSVEASDNSGANTVGTTGKVTVIWSFGGDY